MIGEVFLFEENDQWNEKLRSIIPSNCSLIVAHSCEEFMRKIFTRKVDLLIIGGDLKNEHHRNILKVVENSFNEIFTIVVSESYIPRENFCKNPQFSSLYLKREFKQHEDNIKLKIASHFNKAKASIFISYSRQDSETSKIIKRLEHNIQRKISPIDIRRDVRDLSFKDNLESYMNLIAQGQYVIPIISDKYLKSKYCMYEFVKLHKNGNFEDKIYPIITASANIYSIEGRKDYYFFWQEKLAPFEYDNFPDPEIEDLKEIRDTFIEIVTILKKMFTLEPEMLNSSGYQELIDELTDNLENDGYTLWK